MTGERTGDSAAAQRIRNAAVEAFAEFGYGGSSTRGIASRIGMSPTAIYAHYRSKEELLFAIAIEGHNELLATLRSVDDPRATYVNRLRGLVRAFTIWQAQHRKLARVVQYELDALPARQYHVVSAIRRETSQFIRDIAKGGKAAGEFHFDDPDDVVLAISSLCVDVCRWFPSAQHRSPERLGDTYADIANRLVT